jgi:hypothetical protein
VEECLLFKMPKDASERNVLGTVVGYKGFTEVAFQKKL